MIKQKEGESVCRFIHAADADILSKEKSGPTGARTAGPIRYGTRPIRKKRSTGAYRESFIRSALLHEEMTIVRFCAMIERNHRESGNRRDREIGDP